MRRRLTRDGLFRRTAAPDSFSGRNMNTPINLYDTKPNARFPVGSKVTFVDDKWLKIRGTVLGHAAEDRLWVQMPNEVIQADVEDVVGLDEVTERVETRPPGYIESSRQRRNATVLTFDGDDGDDREAWRDEGGDDDGDLEFIPDKPDFIDGSPVVTDEHPTNEILTDELPSEQDSRDKIEISDDDDCMDSEVIVELINSCDMTDMIEDWITSARREAIWQGIKDWFTKAPEAPETERDKVLRRIMEEQDSEDPSHVAATHNIFKDDDVIEKLEEYGMNQSDIAEFAKLRQEQLDQFHSQPGGPPAEHQWGQGKGVNLTVSRTPKKQKTPAPQTPAPKKQIYLAWPKIPQGMPPLSQAEKYYIQKEFAPAVKRGQKPPEMRDAQFTARLENFFKKQLAQGGVQKPQAPAASRVAAEDEEEPSWVLQQLLPYYDNDPREVALNFNLFNDLGIRQFLSDHGLSMDEINMFANIRKHQLEKARKFYNKYNSTYKWKQGTGVKYKINRRTPAAQPASQPTPQPATSQPASQPAQQPTTPTASRSLRQLRDRTDLVSGPLDMPRTAHVLRQTVDLISAVHELDNGGPLDEVTKRALRNTSRDLLMATDHLKGINSRVANRIAGEIEQFYVDALSN